MKPQAMPKTNVDKPSVATIFELPNSASIWAYVAVYIADPLVLSMLVRRCICSSSI